MNEDSPEYAGLVNAMRAAKIEGDIGKTVVVVDKLLEYVAELATQVSSLLDRIETLERLRS